MKFRINFDIQSIIRPKLDRLVILACLLAAFATALLVAMYYLYIPLRIDSGWYSYPAFCLSEGRDPGENYLRVSDLKDKQGIKVVFDMGDDFRRSIRVLPLELWFKTLGTSVWMAKLYGIMEYFILLAVMFLVLRQITRDRNILLLCFGVYFMDTGPIWFGSNNLRPDVFITAMALMVFLLARRDDRVDHRMLIFSGGVVAMFVLPLIRITSTISLVFLFSYLVIELSLSWYSLSRFKKWFYLSLILSGAIGYLLRDNLLDMIIPSGHSPQLAYHMDRYAYRILKRKDLIWKLSKELERWQAYFKLSNIGTLLSILLALGLLLTRRLSQTGEIPKRKAMPIGLSLLPAIAVLAIFDPTASSAHALPIVAFFILLLARELEWISLPWARKWVIPLLLLIVLGSAGIRLAQGIHVSAKSIKNGYSNVTVIQAMDSLIEPSGKNYVIFGPAELWPYFDRRSNVLIVDFRREWNINRLSDAIKSVDYIIVDKSYVEMDWESNFLNQYPGIKLATVRKVGNPDGDWFFLKVLKPSYSE